MQETNIKQNITSKSASHANNTAIYAGLAAISFVLAFLLIPDAAYTSFPYLAVGLAFIIIDLLIFIFKPQKDFYLGSLLFFAIAIAFFIFYRANPFLTFLNVVASVYLTSYLAIYTQPAKMNLGNIFFAPVIAFFETLGTSNNYRIGGKGSVSQSVDKIKPSEKRLNEIAVGGIVSILLIIVVVPLLAYANPIFNDMVTSIVNALSNISLKIFSLSMALRILFFLLFLFLIPRLASYASVERSVSEGLIGEIKVSLWIPKLILSIIIGIFFLTQFQLYFSSPEILQELGYSNSDYAREVFAQLTVVALIIIGLIYVDPKENKGFNKILSYILAAEGIFLTFIGLKSVMDYVGNWGFTFRRLYGFAGVFWAIGAFIFIILKGIQKKSNAILLSQLLLLSVGTIFLINLVNFDYAIYHSSKKTTTHEGVDYEYLSRLSADADSYNDQLLLITTIIEEFNNDKTVSIKYDRNLRDAGYKIRDNLNRLQAKYDNSYSYDHYSGYRKIEATETPSNIFDYRTFNFSEYKAYKSYNDSLILRFSEEVKKYNTKEAAGFNTNYSDTSSPHLNDVNQLNMNGTVSDIEPETNIAPPQQIKQPENKIVLIHFSDLQPLDQRSEYRVRVGQNIQTLETVDEQYIHKEGLGNFTASIQKYTYDDNFEYGVIQHRASYKITQNDINAGFKSVPVENLR